MSKVIQRAGCSILLHLSQVFPYKMLVEFKKLQSRHLNHNVW